MKIIPYVETNGMRSIPDHKMIELYHKMESLGLVEVVFFNGEIDTADKFLFMMKSHGNVVNVVLDGEDIVFLSWLNTFDVNSAFAHFCAFPEIWGGRAVEVAQMVIKYWFDFKHNDEYVLDIILGKIPTINKRAINFIQKVGFTIVGEIPLLAHGQDKSKRIGDAIAYITR